MKKLVFLTFILSISLNSFGQNCTYYYEGQKMTPEEEYSVREILELDKGYTFSETDYDYELNFKLKPHGTSIFSGFYSLHTYFYIVTLLPVSDLAKRITPNPLIGQGEKVRLSMIGSAVESEDHTLLNRSRYTALDELTECVF